MSQENVERLRMVYDAVSRGDWDAAFENAPLDLEMKTPDTNPIAGTYRGLEAVRGFFDEFWAAFAEVRLEPEKFIDLEDRILVFVLMRLRPTDSDAIFEDRVAHLWSVGEGHPVRFEAFREWKEGLEAVGLSEQDAHADS